MFCCGKDSFWGGEEGLQDFGNVFRVRFRQFITFLLCEKSGKCVGDLLVVFGIMPHKKINVRHGKHRPGFEFEARNEAGTWMHNIR